MRRISGGAAVVAIVLVSINLRPGATSVGPVLEEIRLGLNAEGWVAGILTGLPGLSFGAVGLAAVPLARRTGLTRGITFGIVLCVLGLLLRATTTSTVFFLALTMAALAGMALGNVLVPAWIKTHARPDTVLLPTVYGTVLIVGGSIGSAFTAPVAATAGWRWSLGMWGLLAVAALPIWLWLTLRESATATTQRRTKTPGRPMTSSPTAVAMAIVFGIQSMHAYVQFGWLPQIYRDAGLEASTAGGLMALAAGTGIFGAMLMPSAVSRMQRSSALMIAFGLLLAGGYLGLLLAPATAAWVWALMLGVAGWVFPMLIALLTARTREPAVTARLSGFVQPIGYVLAALGPVLVGIIHQATGDWDLVLIGLIATAVPFTLAGIRATRPVWIDDEIALVRRQ